MSAAATMTGAVPVSTEAKAGFAVCFAALVATSFCFILRAFSQIGPDRWPSGLWQSSC